MSPLIAPSESSLENWRLEEQRQDVAAPAEAECKRRCGNRLSHPTPRRGTSVVRLPATRTEKTKPQVTGGEREQRSKSE